jgi:hypothetical protein
MGGGVNHNTFAKIMTELQKNKKARLLLFAVFVLGFLAYLTIRFNDYLASNAQGMCWTEGRKLTHEELHIRALKMMILEEQKKFDQDPKELSVDFYWRHWKVVKADADPDTLFKLRLNYAFINDSFRDIKLLQEVGDKQLHNDAFYKELIEKKYMLNSITDSNFQQGDLWRIGTSKIYAKEEMDKSIVQNPDVEDKWRGFGSYYVYLEKMGTSDPVSIKKTIYAFNTFYEINNCADSYYMIWGNFKQYGDLGVSLSPPTHSKKTRAVEHMLNPIVVLFNFLKGH